MSDIQVEAVVTMLTCRDKVEIDSLSIAVHVETSVRKLPYYMDNCSKSAFCMQCTHWRESKQRWIRKGYFTESFFERKEFRSNKLHRMLCLFCSNFNVTISQKDIFSYVWYNTRCRSPSSVSVMIYDLRILLSEQNIDVVNVRGVGYRVETRHPGCSV